MSLEKISFNKRPADNSASLEKRSPSTDIKESLSSFNLQKTFDMASRVAISYKANIASKS